MKKIRSQLKRQYIRDCSISTLETPVDRYSSELLCEEPVASNLPLVEFLEHGQDVRRSRKASRIDSDDSAGF